MTQPIPLSPNTTQPSLTLAFATLAGGCFWCMEPPFDKLNGVLETVVGYTGGHLPNPTYEDICRGDSGHAEAVRITFDPSRLSYRDLLATFWRNIDPTAVNRQFFDVGTQYRTVIYYHDETQKREAEASLAELKNLGVFAGEIATTVEPAVTFYPAEDYHQDYYRKCPMRYQTYKQGSGRETFLNRHWPEKPASRPNHPEV
jgi:methionine-S-sulfoxide reductase